MPAQARARGAVVIEQCAIVGIGDGDGGRAAYRFRLAPALRVPGVGRNRRGG